MKFKYITFKDAPQLKTKNEPDEMIADVKRIDDAEIVKSPWVEATSTQLAEYQLSILDVMGEYSKSQPFFVDVAGGVREERFVINGELRPKPKLEPENS